MKNIFKKSYNFIKPYLPFIILFLVYFMMHLVVRYIGDDAINHDNTYPDGQISYLIFSYNNWSSRLFIYLVNNYMYMLPIIVWKILDTIVVVTGAICISKIFNVKKNLFFDYIICLLVTIYPFKIMGSAGFVATTLTYYWPMVFLLICLIPIKKLINKEKINPFLYPLYFVLLLYATDSEQISALLFGLSICFIIYFKFIKKEKINWYVITLLLFSIGKLIFIETCPGNALRTIKETGLRFPEYTNMTLMDKLYMGLMYTTHMLISNFGPLFILSAFLFVMTNITNNSLINKIIANIMFAVVSLVTAFSGVGKVMFGRMYDIISNLGVMILSPEYNRSILSVAFCVMLYLGILYLLLINFKKNLLPVILFLAGVATQFILAFSPTIYASGERTGSIMFYLIVIINIIIYKEIDPKLTDNKKALLLSSVIGVSLVFVIKYFLTFYF